MDVINTEKDKYDFTYEDIKKVADILVESGPTNTAYDETIKVFPPQYRIVFNKDAYNSNSNDMNDEIHRNMDKISDFMSKVFVMTILDPKTESEDIEIIKKNMLLPLAMFDMKTKDCTIL